MVSYVFMTIQCPKTFDPPQYSRLHCCYRHIISMSGNEFSCSHLSFFQAYICPSCDMAPGHVYSIRIEV